MIQFLSSKNHIILGGDVYECLNGEIEITYDNWHFEESSASEVVQSRELALSYIEKYDKENNGQYVYSVVI